MLTRLLDRNEVIVHETITNPAGISKIVIPIDDGWVLDNLAFRADRLLKDKCLARLVDQKPINWQIEQELWDSGR